VRALVRAGRDVEPLRRLGIDLAVGDLRDAASVRAACRGVRYVYHCGALVSDWGSRADFQQTNVVGTQHVVEAAVAEGVQRLVHLSSAAVYGYPRRDLIDESCPQRSRRIPYIETKIAAEQVVRRAVDQHRLPAVMLRPVMVFGPGCQNYVGEVIRHLRRGSLVLFDRGRHVAGLAYVENVVDAIVLAGQGEAAAGQAWNVWDDSPVTWKEYFDALADGIGVRRAGWSLPTSLAYGLAVASEAAGRLVRLRHRPWLTRMAVLELGRSQCYDISLARRHLGYTPRIAWDQALQETLRWARKHV
jgi:nucleoside-diphosphate-sugar epimerase